MTNFGVYIQWDRRKVKKQRYLLNRCENRNSKPTLWSPTSDFAYWGTFSTPKSNVFVQENGFDFWKSLMFPKKMLLKKFSNSNSRSVMQKILPEPNFPTFIWPIILIFGVKKFFRITLKFQKKIPLHKAKKVFFENQFFEKWFLFWVKSEQVFKNNFSGNSDFPKFLLQKGFFEIFVSTKFQKILLDKYFGIWRRKCAPVGKIQSFTS